MPRKKYTPEEIVAKLRLVDVVSQGQQTADAIRQIVVSAVTYYRWRQEYGGLKTDQVKRLKELLEAGEYPSAPGDLGPDAGQAHSAGGRPGETSKPRASPRLYRADPRRHACLRANDPIRAAYLVNAYRVLLTRARQGMVIYVPFGSEIDDTRKPAFYDEAYAFLCDGRVIELT